MANGNKNDAGGMSNTHYIVLGAVLLLVGIFMVFQNAEVRTQWYVWRIGSLGMPTGVAVVPLLVGIGLWAYRPKWLVGKIIIGAGLVFLLLTLLLSVNIHFRRTGLFNYILMFGGVALGLGLLARGYFGSRKKDKNGD